MKDDEFIQVGVECYFRHPTRAEAKAGKGLIETAPPRPILAKKTKELENAEKQMLKNFAEAIAPLIKNDIAIGKTRNLKGYIAEQEEKRDKAIKTEERQHERNIRKIKEKYDRNINVAKRYLEQE